MNILNKIARLEKGIPPKLGDERPCPLCAQPVKLVEGIDTEYYLQSGILCYSGTTWIHLSPGASAKCRRVRGR